MRIRLEFLYNSMQLIGQELYVDDVKRLPSESLDCTVSEEKLVRKVTYSEIVASLMHEAFKAGAGAAGADFSVRKIVYSPYYLKTAKEV